MGIIQNEGYSSTIKLIEFDDGKEFARLELSGQLVAMDLNHDGTILVTADTDGIIAIWNLADDILLQERKIFESRGHDGISAIILSHDEKRLVSSSMSEKAIQLWRIIYPDEARVIQDDWNQAVANIEKTLFNSPRSMKEVQYNPGLETLGTLDGRFFSKHLQLSPDDNLLVSSNWGIHVENLEMWVLDNRKKISTGVDLWGGDRTSIAHNIKWSPDSKYFVTVVTENNQKRIRVTQMYNSQSNTSGKAGGLIV